MVTQMTEKDNQEILRRILERLGMSAQAINETREVEDKAHSKTDGVHSRALFIPVGTIGQPTYRTVHRRARHIRLLFGHLRDAERA